MITLSQPAAPHCLGEFANMAPQPDFGIFAFQDCKDEIRARLVINQHYQCAYCERPIEDEAGAFHIDHVKSQHDAPHLRFVITNLVASCETTDTCGHNHGSLSVPDELHPYSAPDLHLAFKCDSLGELTSSSLSAAAQQFAFVQLNLNHPGLKAQRKIVIAKLQQYTLAAGTNARRKLKHLSTRSTGFISLHFQELGRFGFALPA